MKTHSFKRWIAGLLSAALCLSAFFGLGITKVFAKGEQAEVCLVSFPREGDANYSTTTYKTYERLVLSERKVSYGLFNGFI